MGSHLVNWPATVPQVQLPEGGEWRLHITCIDNDCFHGDSCDHPKLERDVWWGPWRDIDKPRHGRAHPSAYLGPICSGYMDGCTLSACGCICHESEVA